MLEVQKYLKEHTIKELCNEYKIHCKTYEEGLYLLNYTIYSPLFVNIVEECRGLILDDKFNVVSKSFSRFYNINEKPNTVIDYANSIFYKKLDGDLINLYYNTKINEWCFSTKGDIYAEDVVKNNLIYKKIKQDQITYKELLLRIIFYTSAMIDEFLKDYRNYTFSFEMVTPDNKNVVYYHEYSLYYIGCHNNITGEYTEIDFSLLQNITSVLECPKLKNITNGKELNKYLDSLSYNDEGIVIYNKNTKNFIKYKNPKYLEKAYMNKDHICMIRNYAYMLCKDEINEYISYFPNDKSKIDEYTKQLQIKSDEIIEIYNRYKNLPLNEFALKVKNNKLKRLLIHMYKYKTTFIESLMNCDNIKTFEIIFGKE